MKHSTTNRGGFRILTTWALQYHQVSACTQRHATFETASQTSREGSLLPPRYLYKMGLTSMSHTNWEGSNDLHKPTKLHYHWGIKWPFTDTGKVTGHKRNSVTTETKAGTTLSAFENRRNGDCELANESPESTVKHHKHQSPNHTRIVATIQWITQDQWQSRDSKKSRGLLSGNLLAIDDQEHIPLHTLHES